MRAFFSEFSYGFALTNELVEIYRELLTAAPVLPSLIAEGRDGGGFDMHLPIRGYPLFLQFKVSERMFRPPAGQWERFGRPYFRFKLHARRHSDQHQMLIDLENQDQAHQVYYASPAFHTAQELNEAFRDRSVLNRTVFFRPTLIGPLPDEDEHCMAFLPNAAHGYLCSQEKEVVASATGKAFADLVRKQSSAREPKTIDQAYLAELATNMEVIARHSLKFGDRRPMTLTPDLQPEQRVVYLARTFFDAELFFVRALDGRHAT